MISWSSWCFSACERKLEQSSKPQAEGVLNFARMYMWRGGWSGFLNLSLAGEGSSHHLDAPKCLVM